MESLSRQDPALDPVKLHAKVSLTFDLVQKAWEARDYSSVRHLLLPDILARHEKLLKDMRNCHDINRVEGLRIERLEFVHLDSPQPAGAQEVTALITFRASVYFIDDRTGAYTYGQRSPSLFQEFWVFRRGEEGWLLQDIEQSHESNRLRRPNIAAGLTDEELVNA
jgi:predicted lipid-binding transport protein (Tim44 family)